MESGEVGERDDLGHPPSFSGNFCPCRVRSLMSSSCQCERDLVGECSRDLI